MLWWHPVVTKVTWIDPQRIFCGATSKGKSTITYNPQTVEALNESIWHKISSKKKTQKTRLRFEQCVHSDGRHLDDIKLSRNIWIKNIQYTVCNNFYLILKTLVCPQTPFTRARLLRSYEFFIESNKMSMYFYFLTIKM